MVPSINTRMFVSQPTAKATVNQALLLTIIVVAAVVMVVVGGVLWLTDRLSFPFLTEHEQATESVDAGEDVADYLTSEAPITAVSKETLARSVLTPPRTFTEGDTEFTESEAVFTQLRGSTLTATIDTFNRELHITSNTTYRKITLYLLDEESGVISGVAHAQASRGDLNQLQEGDKFRVIFESESGTVQEVIIYPVTR